MSDDTIDLPAIAKLEVWFGARLVDHGTAFLCDTRYALTAAHVVADRATPKGNRILLHFGRLAPPHQTEATIVASNPLADWALLELKDPPGAEPLLLGPPPSRRHPFSSFGYSVANPKDGLVFSGYVEDPQATCDGIAAFQLYSHQAAAGNGAPIQGLSGAPCLIDGRVAGIVRSFISKGGAAVAGLIYATPAESLRGSAAEPHVRSDACSALPPLPVALGPPREPFRYLDYYRREDARVFFGRCAEMYRICRQLLDPRGKPLVFLFGQSGVGKSSLLEAGLRPRLEGLRDVRYARRSAEALDVTFASAIGARSSEPGDIAEALTALEAAERVPLVILDQVEEIFANPRAGEPPTAELNRVFAALRTFLDGTQAPRTRVLLSFRKSWLSEIDAVRRGWDLSVEALLLGPIRAIAIPEIVRGIGRREFEGHECHCKVEEALAEAIARDLGADASSPIAPVLQILMSDLYADAKAESHIATPALRLAAYQARAASSLSLESFFDRQTANLRPIEATQTGLVLDVLAFHTTPVGTARRRTADERSAEYADKREAVEEVVKALKDAYVLVDPPEDGREALQATRLAHDTLGPIVRRRFDQSMKRGQRARRVLEGRPPYEDGDRPLNEEDLGMVEEGRIGMRTLRADELELVEASQAARKRRRQTRRLVIGSVVAVVMAAVGAIAYTGRTVAAQERREQEIAAELAQREAEISAGKRREERREQFRRQNLGEFTLSAPPGGQITGAKEMPASRGDTPWSPDLAVSLGVPLPAERVTGGSGFPEGYYVIDYTFGGATYSFGIHSRGFGTNEVIALPTPQMRAGFRFVPGGTVPIGDLLGVGKSDEGPATPIKLVAFWIAENRSPPAAWTDARASAAKAAGRLPSAAEWEWAAILGVVPLGTWEWTRTRVGFPAPYDPEDGRENECALDAKRILKGGAEAVDPELKDNGRVRLSGRERPSRFGSADLLVRHPYRVTYTAEATNGPRGLQFDDGETLVPMDPSELTLTTGARRRLRVVAERWCSTPSRPILKVSGVLGVFGSEEFNLALGDRYAKSVGEFLRAEGVADSQIQLLSFGTSRSSGQTTYYESLRDHGVLIEALLPPRKGE